MDLLPDCRAKHTRGRVFTSAGAWVPFFCANCGKDCGVCPEENMNFMFYLCTPCFKTHGHVAGTMVMPDEVFYQKVRDAQMEKHGRPMTPTEVAAALLDGTTDMAKLAKEAR